MTFQKKMFVFILIFFSFTQANANVFIFPGEQIKTNNFNTRLKAYEDLSLRKEFFLYQGNRRISVRGVSDGMKKLAYEGYRELRLRNVFVGVSGAMALSFASMTARGIYSLAARGMTRRDVIISFSVAGGSLPFAVIFGIISAKKYRKAIDIYNRELLRFLYISESMGDLAPLEEAPGGATQSLLNESAFPCKKYSFNFTFLSVFF